MAYSCYFEDFYAAFRMPDQQVPKTKHKSSWFMPSLGIWFSSQIKFLEESSDQKSSYFGLNFLLTTVSMLHEVSGALSGAPFSVDSSRGCARALGFSKLAHTNWWKIIDLAFGRLRWLENLFEKSKTKKILIKKIGCIRSVTEIQKNLYWPCFWAKLVSMVPCSLAVWHFIWRHFYQLRLWH